MEEPGVAGLRGEAGEARRDLRVEDVRERGLPGAAEDRDVLPPGVEDDLHGRVGEDRGERRGVAHLRERVEHHDLLADADLDQAQERPVAALGHELGVDPEPPELPGTRRETLDVGRDGVHGAAIVPAARPRGVYAATGAAPTSAGSACRARPGTSSATSPPSSSVAAPTHSAGISPSTTDCGVA